jgi:transcriptional regulator with XRE-family HTH domain
MANRFDTSRYLLGAQVRALRQSKQYSLRGLARRAGVSHETLRGIERGSSSPTIATVEKIAAGLRTEVRALLPEIATANRRGPKRRMMLQARVSGTVIDTDGTRWQIAAGKDLLAPDHRIFKSNPSLRRHFEPVEVNEAVRAANKRRAQRVLGTPSTQPKKARPRRTRFSIPE